MNQEDLAQVVKKMISQPEKITGVEASSDLGEMGKEYYFFFPENKYKWSITELVTGTNILYFYPAKGSFLSLPPSEIGEGGEENLKNLFEIIKNKENGFDQVLKDIIENT